MQISSDSLKETEQLAKQLAQNIKGGEIIEFVSDLGGGKTTFISSFVAGLGSSDNVSSPTFTVAKQYTAKQLTIMHYDFYRLPDAGIVADMVAEALQNKQTVTLIEWGEAVKSVLPVERFIIKIDKHATKQNSRYFTFTSVPSNTYLLRGIQA